MKNLILTALAFLLSISITAQVPNGFNYQAVVRDNTGNVLVNKNISVRLSILNGSPTGTSVYCETHSVTTNAYGSFSIQVGTGTVQSGTFSGIDWGNGTKFIEVEADPNAGNNYVLLNTTQLLAVPYALRAAKADSVKGIDLNSTTNWNTAYGWGNHATAGYLKSYTEADSVFVNSPANGITSTNITNWNTAYGWGNHAGLYRPVSYMPAWSEITSKPTTLSGYGITDAMSTSHPANVITSTNITNWNSAYSWGNHSGLYRLASWVPAWTDITGKPAFANVATSGSYADLSNTPFNITTPANNQLLKYNSASGKWENFTPGYLTSYTETDPVWSAVATNYYTKTNMQTSGAASLHFNNLTNKPTTIAGYGITDAMTTAHVANGITYTNITNWNTAYGWGNHAGLYRPVSYVPAWSEITSKPTTLSGYGITDAMSTSHPANGITSTNITNWNSAYSWGNHSGLYRLASWVPAWTDITGKPAFANIATSGSYTDLYNTPFNISVPSNNQLLKYNSVSGKWENFTPSYLTSYTETDPVWTNVSTNYYTKSDLQNSGYSQVNFYNIISKPTTLSGYGISDALTTYQYSTQNGSFGNVALVDDVNPSHFLTITNGADLTTQRTLTLNTGDADRTLQLSGNATISGINTGDQTISLYGDVAGSGNNSFQVALSNSGVAAGTYRSVTVDSKGRVTYGNNPSTIDGYGITDALSSSSSSTQNGYFGNIALVSDYISNYLIITNGSYLSATRTLTLNTGDYNRTLTLSGDASVSGTNTGDQYITLTGDVTGSGSNTFTVSLANSGVQAGTYRMVYVDAKGRVISGSNPTSLSGYGITDAVTANGYITPGTAAKITYDSKGLVTSGASLSSSDIPSLDWSKITSGKPSSLSGYGITDGISTSLSSTRILVGNSSNLATAVALSGDASLSSSGVLTLANSGVSASTYKMVTVDTKGRVTYGYNPTTLSGFGITDAVTANSSITPGTAAKITYDSKGLVTSGASLSSSDIPSLDWSKITSGKPTTLSGYGITNGMSTSMANNSIWVGNPYNQAASVTVSGDATLNNTGVLTLAYTGVTAGTYNSVTVDAKGRVTAGTNPTSISGYGITDAVAKSGNQTISGTKTFSSDLSANGVTVGVGGGNISTNTAVGNSALAGNTTGINNAAVGNGALSANTTGYNNVAVGYYALNKSQTGQDNVAVGPWALYNTSSGIYNTSIGYAANSRNTTGYENVAIGIGTLYSNSTGEDITAIGSRADVSSDGLINATAIGANSIVNASNKVVIGDGNVTTIGGYANWSNYSDKRLKENIVYKNDLGLSFINKLKTVSYNYKADSSKRRRDGLIAQDVDQALKDLNQQFSGLVIDNDKDKTMNLSYGDFVVPLINAVQELSKQNNQMKEEIARLKSDIENLKKH
jgi:trimeric autotransporter adhesin